MNASIALRKQFLIDLRACSDDEVAEFDWPDEITDNNCDEVYDLVCETSPLDDWLCEIEGEFRHSGQDTGLPCDWSRHYESKSVARQLHSGEWVGWTYWYGGGKHGEPEAIDWISDAYFVDVEERMEPVLHFSKRKEQV